MMMMMIIIIKINPGVITCLAEPIRCPAGTFQNITGTDTCQDCPPGFYCTDGEVPLRCPKGRYCPGNTTADQPMCPTGTYNPDLGELLVTLY